MIDSNLNLVINQSITMAINMHHSMLTTEHMLLAIMDNEQGKNIIKRLGGNTEDLKKQIHEYLNAFIQEDNFESKDPIYTSALENILRTMIGHAESTNKESISVCDLLVAILGDRQSYSALLLEYNNITRLELLELIVNDELINKDKQIKEKIKNGPLSLYTRDLIELALNNKIDPVIGRDEEIKRVCEILCRRKKNNPILLGESGVGKTAIAEGIALHIANNTIIEELKNHRIYALDLGALIAGTKYRGDFEKRIKSIMDEVSKIPNCIIFIDEIHTLVGTGSTSGGNLDISNLLKPALANGSFRCIGATTYSEFRNYFNKDKALSRRFSKVIVEEPSISNSIKILSQIAPLYEKFHKVKYASDAIEACVNLSDRFINDRHLPDKALDLLDEAGAYYKIQKKSKIKKQDIESMMQKNINISIKNTTPNLKNLPKKLKQRIFAQDLAIESIYKSLLKNKAGLGNPNKPIGVFLFTGPTGVGKSELSRELALNLDIKFIRFDMSEYAEAHSVAKLIGTPPGYVGFEEGGILVESIRKNPHCVLLLDEIEKAHPSIYNLLLQVFDNASLKDNLGNEANFKNVIIIMTSNIGQNSVLSLGFNKDRKNNRELNETFSKELLGRIDNVVHFNPLSKSTLKLIIKKQIEDMSKRVELNLEIDSNVLDYLLSLDFNASLGAREIERLLDREIKLPLSEIILFKKVNKNNGIHITMKNKKINFNLEEKKIDAKKN